MNQQELVAALRAEARDAPESGIVEVFNYGRGRQGLIPLWVGEGDLPTPPFICDAAVTSLRNGETFYTYQRGIPDLRLALARYHARHYDGPFEPERFYVTGGGMQAIQIACRMVAGNGDEVLVPTPAWPNITAAIGISGARPVEVPMTLGNAGWTLDLDRLFDSANDRTRAIFLNSPSNPTGWTARKDELQAILEFARQRGLWIVADEVYHRFFFAGPRSPSFYDVADRDERVIFVNTFSKNWAMTGWRIGWISAPPALGHIIENLVQYSTSGVAAFMQRAATAALEDGEERRVAGDPRVCSEARLMDRRRRGLPPLLLCRPPLAIVLRRRRPRRAGDLRQHFLQELGDDRLADRLDLRPAGNRPRDRESRPVFDLGRRRLHAARRHRRP